MSKRAGGERRKNPGPNSDLRTRILPTRTGAARPTSQRGKPAAAAARRTGSVSVAGVRPPTRRPIPARLLRFGLRMIPRNWDLLRRRRPHDLRLRRLWQIVRHIYWTFWFPFDFTSYFVLVRASSNAVTMIELGMLPP